jgi:hypothetical protein
MGPSSLRIKFVRRCDWAICGAVNVPSKLTLWADVRRYSRMALVSDGPFLPGWYLPTSAGAFGFDKSRRYGRLPVDSVAAYRELMTTCGILASFKTSCSAHAGRN